ncbi:hypothetical protein ACIPC1_00260 [Streptomyces sp. NPDC087263]|uniref:hypothetical protein n=1 Tax=Streptomyces sp. NPDC087263 TaxID=3365773 RepID=UPI0038024CF6
MRLPLAFLRERRVGLGDGLEDPPPQQRDGRGPRGEAAVPGKSVEEPVVVGQPMPQIVDLPGSEGGTVTAGGERRRDTGGTGG